MAEGSELVADDGFPARSGTGAELPGGSVGRIDPSASRLWGLRASVSRCVTSAAPRIHRLDHRQGGRPEPVTQRATSDTRTGTRARRGDGTDPVRRNCPLASCSATRSCPAEVTFGAEASMIMIIDLNE